VVGALIVDIDEVADLLPLGNANKAVGIIRLKAYGLPSGGVARARAGEAMMIKCSLRRAIPVAVAIGLTVATGMGPLAAASASSRVSPGTLLGDLPAAAPGDFTFGGSIAFSGNTAIVGSTTAITIRPGVFQNGPGVAYIYEKRGASWSPTPVATLDAPSGGDFFGAQVSISGNTALVSDPTVNGDPGDVYVYVRSRAGWPTTPTVTLTTPDGIGGAVLSGHTIALIAGTPGSDGDIDIYSEATDGWPTTPTAVIPNFNSQSFSSPLTLSGATLTFSSENTTTGDKAVDIYTEGKTGWPSTPSAVLPDPSGVPYSCFGEALAVSGKTLVVGSPTGCGAEGVAYLYTDARTGWPSAPSATLQNPSAAPVSHEVELTGGFGSVVAVSGDAVVISDPDVTATSGASYIYTKGNAGFWPTVPTVALADPQATKGDRFGWALAMSGTTLFVDAVGADSNQAPAMAGQVYLFQS
jgi:FG-GAP repeat protein